MQILAQKWGEFSPEKQNESFCLCNFFLMLCQNVADYWKYFT